MKSVILIISLLLFFHLKQRNDSFYLVKSTIDNKSYKVKKTEDKYRDLNAANTLAKINVKIEQLINSLSNIEFKDKLQNAKLKLRERIDEKDLAYTLNKGDVIGLCIESNENALFFVLLHELAHVVTPEYGHTELFWNNFEKLIKKSVDLGIYDYKNYNKNPVNFCNGKISYTPYIKNNNI